MINLSQETEDLAKRLAAAQGLSLEEAIRQALDAAAHAIGVLPEPQRRRDQSPAAVAFDRYGKGIDPKARLNLADCAAYALAATMNAPLLFKGDDFAATDMRACL